ncbi:MAG TPA: NAD(P)H-dependent oxidoreductase subunit E [Terriglobales bacterium]|jgi:NADH-quinone oxidoreductase subunit F|nr:NAD(P)H-dependent oxidoreductase subunit E [Terriglobales bacterium]
MDLHFTGAEATADERAAVDGVSIPANANGTRRSYLLPVLHAIQNRMGWISPGALNYASRVLEIPPAEAFGVADFYGLFSTRPQPPTVAHICDDIGCQAQGADKLCAELERAHGPEGSDKNGKTWRRSPCLGLCEQAPAALVHRAGVPHLEQAVAFANAEDILTAMLGTKLARRELGASVPQAGQPGLKLLRRIGQVNPESLDQYRATGGFQALRRAFEIGPLAVVREVVESKLVGRGGAAFPCGQKWNSILTAPRPRCLVCNADESEPGTFKDRVLMEGDPYAVIESMIIAAFATGCEQGYLYIRGEYPLARRRLEQAIRESRTRGFLGNDILGHGVSFDIELRVGAGAYICGEETAMLNSIEGRRGEPRNKPPFPTEVGLFGQPTIIQNVETLLNVPYIVLEGGKAFAAVGTERSTGTKLFCLSGHVARPGVYEVVFGTTLRQLLELAGGMGGTGKLQAVLIGGAAGAFLGPKDLDTPLTFEGTRAAGATLGSAVVMPFDDTVDLRQTLLRIAAFFRDESCGQCVPCRVGTVRQEEILHRLAAGKPLSSHSSELVLLKEVGQAMRDASICGLGQTASSAIESALARLPVFEDKR